MEDRLEQIKESHVELDQFVRQLDEACFQRGAASFPTATELDRLNSLIVELGKAINKKHFELVHFWDVVTALDGRYAKLGLKDFFDKLVEKLVSLPQGPLTRIKKRLEAGNPDAPQLEQLAEMVEEHDLSKGYTQVEWASLYPVILPFTTGAFQTLAKNSMDGYSFEHGFQTEAFKKAFGYAAFADVLAQRLSWKLEYGGVFDETAARVYILLNPDYDKKLRETFYGDLPTLKQMKDAHKRAGERDRQREHRAKEKLESQA